jgi:hypothetical protein
LLLRANDLGFGATLAGHNPAAFARGKTSKRRFHRLLPFLHRPCRILLARSGASTSAGVTSVGREADLIALLARGDPVQLQRYC